jgi:hypothetical protein
LRFAAALCYRFFEQALGAELGENLHVLVLQSFDELGNGEGIRAGFIY